MEEEPSDPHEKQLFAVFKSCLAKDQSGLDKDGLINLCTKLDLEESHKDAILRLSKVNTDNKFVSFNEFRDEFLALLGNSQEKEVNGESEALSKTNTMYRLSHPKSERKQVEAMNCQHIDIDPIQRLQETWSNQNCFTIEDVNSFFNRGSALPKQTIEIIFEKLDGDCDGLINFDEFLHFFQSVNNKIHEQSSLNWSVQGQNTKDYVNQHMGTVSKSVIVDLWEVAGVTEPNSLLLDLGFNGPTVSLVDLSNALTSELKLHHDVSHSGGVGEYVRLLKGALILYQEEVRNLNSSMEHLCCERAKLRADINEANERANVLAQEIDEHQIRMDKACQEQVRQLEVKHSEAMKDLTEQQHLEREKSTLAINTLEGQLQASQQEEQRIKAELVTLLDELKSLEKENHSQNEEIAQLQATNIHLTKQMRELADAHDQVESIETKENEQVTDLMSHINRLQAEMKVLRDHNDELTSELEMLKNRDNDAKSIVSSVEVRSTISDENDGLASIPTTEVSDTEDEDKTHSRPPKKSKRPAQPAGLNKLSEIIQEFRNFMTSAKFCTECATLRNEVSSLISELELYQSSVPQSTTAATTTRVTDNSSNNNNSGGGGRRKKPLKNLANELEAETEDHPSESCSYLNWQKRTSSSDDRIHDLDDTYGNLDFRSFQNKFSGLKDYSLHREIENNEELSNNNLEIRQENGRENSLNEEPAKHTAEKKKLLDRCLELEESLRLLRVEYEQCEDYWASKLDEERQIFEQEQKISDEKFSELIAKMAEYEEQFSACDKVDGRLSPIEEKVNLEQQYNDLEDEFERLKLEFQEELDKKEAMIEELKAKLSKSEKLPLTDMSVQFPDEQMKTLYPELYSHLCSPSGGSVESASSKSEAAVPIESTSQQCVQCHKVPGKCECFANVQQQQCPQPNQGDQRIRRNEGKNRHYHHYYPKKTDLDFEVSSLIKQKEKLKQDIMKLQSLKSLNANHIYPLIGVDEQQNIFTNLYTKMYNQDQKLRYMQVYCQTQQKDHERIIQSMWKAHLLESNDLRFVIKATEDKLNHQIKINKEQKEKLTKADFLSKELYVENAQLSEAVKRLEEHCQILSQNRVDSTTA